MTTQARVLTPRGARALHPRGRPRDGHSLSAELSAPPGMSWDGVKRTPSSRLGAFWLSRWPTVLT